MKKLWIALMGLVLVGGLHAEDMAAPEAAAPVAMEPVPVAVEATAQPPQAAAARFIVIIPEQVDNVWYWVAYTSEQQHIVQSAVEKALVDAGLDVIDVGMLKLKADGQLNALLSPAAAAATAREAGATYVIVGTATAVDNGQGTALGTSVARAVANLSARIVRVSDGKIVAVKETEAKAGAQAMRAAGQAALRTGGAQLAHDLVEAAKKLDAAPPQR